MKADTLPLMPHGTSLGPHEALASQTYKGMAHFAMTGPTGETCRTCQHWKTLGERYANNHTLKPAPCGKFTELTQHIGAAVPPNAAACRHFVANPKPHPMKPPGFL